MGLFNFKKESKPKITIEKIKNYTHQIFNKTKVDINFSEDMLYRASRIQVKAYHYNFDEGYQGIYELLEDGFCDKSTALIFYWLNSPLFYLNNPNSTDRIHKDGLKLKNYLEKRIQSGDFKEILQFVPIDFIEGPMYMSEELIEKESYLNEIPIDFFLPVGMNYSTTGTCNKVNKYLRLQGIETLYFFDPESCSDVKEIPATESLVNLNICFNGYIRVKPKIGSIEDLLHLKDLQSLKMDFDIKFAELGKLIEFKNLQELKINVGKENYSSFVDLKNLKRLSFTNVLTTELKVVRDMLGLKKLEIRWSPRFIDLSGIENLKDLVSLKIEGCKKLKDISQVFELRKLKTLILKEVELTAKSLQGMNTLSIETLHLDCRKLAHLDFLLVDGKLMESIRELHLYRSTDNEKLPEKIVELSQGTAKIYEYIGFNDKLK